jgi:hypothetical protein
MDFTGPMKYDTLVTSGITTEAISIQNNRIEALSTFSGFSIYATKIQRDMLYKKFLQLKEKWEVETLFVSSATDIINNGSYLAIISLGQEALSFIIKDFAKKDNHWFYALEVMTGKNPISEEHIGNIKLMKDDWINWAKENDII